MAQMSTGATTVSIMVFPSVALGINFFDICTAIGVIEIFLETRFNVYISNTLQRELKKLRYDDLPIFKASYDLLSKW